MWELVCVCWVGVRRSDECGTKVRAGTPQSDAVMAELINNAARYRSFIFGWFFLCLRGGLRFSRSLLHPADFWVEDPPASQPSPSCYPHSVCDSERNTQGPSVTQIFHHCLRQRRNRDPGGCFFDQHSNSPPTWTNQAIINAPIGSRILYLPFPSAIMWGSD